MSKTLSGSEIRTLKLNIDRLFLDHGNVLTSVLLDMLIQVISSSSVTIFERISEEFRPTPLHPHYIFTHHDVARVMQGMMLFSSRTKSRPRPKVRHTWRMVTDMVQNARETTILNDRRDSLDLGNASCQEQSNLHQEKRYAYGSTRYCLNITGFGSLLFALVELILLCLIHVSLIKIEQPFWISYLYQCI